MNIDDKTNELIYGEEGAKKIKLLNDGLLEIELKYIDYFKKRKPKYESEEHDRLHNHYMYITNPNRINFSFIKNTELDQKIINDCLSLFNSIFNLK